MKTVGEVLIEPYEVDDFITILFKNNYVVELSKINTQQNEKKFRLSLKKNNKKGVKNNEKN